MASAKALWQGAFEEEQGSQCGQRLVNKGKVGGDKIKKMMRATDHRQPRGPHENFGFCPERTGAVGSSEQGTDVIWVWFSQTPSGCMLGMRVEAREPQGGR